MKTIAIPTACLALALAAGTALAAPCATGTTTGANGKVTTDTTSKADGASTAKVTPGAKAESPGTVGALNNVGGNTVPDANERKPAEGQVVKGQGSEDC